jgi:Tol biopolymer transport system component
VPLLAAATLLGGLLVIATPAQATAPGTNGRIAYSRFSSHNSADIVSANPDGTGVVRLTNPPAGTFDFNPDWKPDGTKIAFERDTPAGGEIFTMNANGSDVRQITFDEFPGAGDPSWSPDGTRIAVERFDIPAGRDGIYIMHADGTHPVQVTQSDALLGENAEPQWSPDGKKLVLQIVSDSKGSAVFTVNLDGTHLRQLTPYGLFAEHPDWSPDGHLIIFEDYGNGAPPGVSTNVFTVRPDGSHLTNVTNDEGGAVNAANPAWSPDGNKIVFVLFPGDGPNGFADVYTMNTDGSDIHQVTTSKLWDFRPDWGSES